MSELQQLVGEKMSFFYGGSIHEVYSGIDWAFTYESLSP